MRKTNKKENTSILRCIFINVCVCRIIVVVPGCSSTTLLYTPTVLLLMQQQRLELEIQRQQLVLQQQQNALALRGVLPEQLNSCGIERANGGQRQYHNYNNDGSLGSRHQQFRNNDSLLRPAHNNDALARRPQYPSNDAPLTHRRRDMRGGLDRVPPPPQVNHPLRPCMLIIWWAGSSAHCELTVLITSYCARTLSLGGGAGQHVIIYIWWAGKVRSISLQC